MQKTFDTDYFDSVSTPKGCLVELRRLLGRRNVKLAPASQTVSARLKAALGYTVMGSHQPDSYQGTPEWMIKTLSLGDNLRPESALLTDYTPAKNAKWFANYDDARKIGQADLFFSPAPHSLQSGNGNGSWCICPSEPAKQSDFETRGGFGSEEKYHAVCQRCGATFKPLWCHTANGT